MLKRSILVLLVAGAGVARAADPQPYKVAIQGTGFGDMDGVLRSSSQLASLQDKVPVPPFALVQRAQSDVARFQTALDSFGYYLNGVTIKIAGHELSDPELPEILDAAPGNPPVTVDVAIDKGPLFHIGTIAFDGTVPAADRDAVRIRSGDPAIANAVLDAQAQLLSALQEDGYALAIVEAPVAFADNEQHTVNLTYRVITGPRVAIGHIVFSGLKDVHEDFVRKVLTVKPGDRYRPSRIEEARQAVAGLGVFSGVTVHAATKLDDDGRIALTFDVQERPQHAVSLTGTYSTDLGISLGATWSHRNLFGNAEQLNLSAAGTGLGTSTSGLGYNLGAQFIKPQFGRPDRVLEFDILGVRQQLDAFDQTAESVAVYLRRKFSALWSGSVGAMLQYDQVAQENTNRLYQLIALPLTVNYNSTGLSDLLRDPVSGGRASVAVTPTQSFGANSLAFLVLQASGSAYFDLGEPGRSVLALRALAGSIMGGSNLELPPDQRLYAGGSATVRGFAYQSIGPQFADQKPVGAKSVDAATIEFRQRILEDYGVAAFVDAGQASAVGAPFSGAVRVGAGIGARYYTPLGAVRAAIAVPLNRIPGGDAFELYIGLGQAF
ncbi:MAG: BamA/TamA family outer membrane protein [Rhizomicrobium sp.]